MSSRESAIIFDDGSIESKVLQHELKTSYDITTVSVNQYQPGDLQKWLEKSIEITEGLLKGIVKVILHFPFEDYVQKDIRTEIMELQRKNPNLRIIPWYEQAPRDNIKNRAANYGIMEDMPPREQPNRVQEQLKDIKETVIDPDDEMKRSYSKEYLEDIGHIASDIVKDNPTKKSRKKKWNI